MRFILKVILFISYQYICLNKINENIINSESLNNISDNLTDIGLSKNYSIPYRSRKNFSFNIKDNNAYQINIHSINCNFKIDFSGEIINKINLDTYSLKMNSTNKNVIIEPIIDIINGEEKEDYDIKQCYLTINSINESQPEVKIENGQSSIFYFKSKDYDSLNILYEIKENEVSNNSFAALFFQFNEKCKFSIDIT